MRSIRTLTSMRLSGLAKLSCTPAQHTGMLVVLSSVGGAVMLGGTSGWVVRRESGCQQQTVAHNNCDEDNRLEERETTSVCCTVWQLIPISHEPVNPDRTRVRLGFDPVVAITCASRTRVRPG